MRVSVEEVSPSRRALTVEVPADRVGPRVEAAYRTLGQRVSLPGFRKGRVPRALLEQRFRGQVREDVIRDLIPVRIPRDRGARREHERGGGRDGEEPRADPEAEEAEAQRHSISRTL